MKINHLSLLGFILTVALTLLSCNKDEAITTTPIPEDQSAITRTFSTKIDLENLANYANQPIPDYINRDNTGSNVITDAGATLGRVLFYDRALSANNLVACASCHRQELAFSDDLQASMGVNGPSERHSMRLINTRFSDEERFFWDERADNLEAQTTQPIQNHIEMGYSGQEGDQGLSSLITKLESIDYYQELFTFVYGDTKITEERIQNALAQFVRSIQSFDAKYDLGRAQVQNDNAPFPNYSQQENLGKMLFFAPPQFNNTGVRIGGGVGCAGCHGGSEFSINPNSGNNGVIGTISGIGTDLTVTRAPTLRDVVKANGEANGPFMHIGVASNLMAVLNHYDQINLAGNPRLDPKLRPGGNPQNLAMTQDEKQAIVAFMRTLAGTEVYTAEKWANPFE